MPCDSIVNERQSKQQREEELKAALKKLETQLQAGQVVVKIGQQGAIAFAGWNERKGMTDACAYRKLISNKSWALRQALARAEATSGRKVNQQAISAGVHSHDGGKTWGVD